MESQPQNPEFRNNPENFHPCIHPYLMYVSSNSSGETVHIHSLCLVHCCLQIFRQVDLKMQCKFRLDCS